MSRLQTAAEARSHSWMPPPFEVAELAPAIAAEWTPDHVARRMVEAFRVDRRLPRIERPKAPGSAHPTMEFSREEIAEWEPIEIDPSRFAPTRVEIAAMEAAFAWLLIVRESDPDAQFALKIWALSAASGNSLRRFCRKTGAHRVTLLKRKDRALRVISSELNADSVGVV
jgi:hypothetical protein